MHTNPFEFHALGAHLARVHTKRLALRPVALSDAWPLFEATRNAAFNSHLMWDRPEDEQAVIARVDGVMEAARRGQVAAVSAVLKSTGEWVALYRFIPHALDAEVVEMGLWIHARYWNGGFGVELTSACVNAAFDSSDVQVLLGASSADNVGSCKVLEACGLSRNGRVESRACESGVKVPLHHFSLSRTKWLAGHPHDTYRLAAAQPEAPTKTESAVRQREIATA
jgi:RimJ/RimL family protein N-acetyltransferase